MDGPKITDCSLAQIGCLGSSGGSEPYVRWRALGAWDEVSMPLSLQLRAASHSVSTVGLSATPATATYCPVLSCPQHHSLRTR